MTPDPVSNSALTDSRPIFTQVSGRENSGVKVLKQFQAVRQVNNFWGITRPTAIPPCYFPTSSCNSWEGKVVLGIWDGTFGEKHHKYPCLPVSG